MGNDIPIDEFLANIKKISFRDFSRIDPDIAKLVFRLPYIAFKVRPDFGKPYVSEINPGPVPPTYVHSWAVDISGFFKFRLAESQYGLELNWTSGDHFIIYVPETGQTIKISSLHEMKNTNIELDPLPSTFPVRIYIILRISKDRYASDNVRRHRRFNLKGVYPLDPSKDPSAVLIGDDLNYDTSKAPHQDPWFDDGTKEKPYHGWIQGNNTLAGAKVEEPKQEEGWYLLSRFTPSPGQAANLHVYALVFYNEQVSRLRIYLLPGNRLVAATGIEVRLRLLARAPGTKSDFVMLEGAFFDDDSRPHKWREALLIVPTLSLKKWTMVETNMLYPMAKDLPSGQDTSGPGIQTEDPRFPNQEDWFKPVYDSMPEGYESWMGNMRLQAEITPFQQATADLDFIGKGVGQAIQEFNSTGGSFFNSLKDTVSSAVTAGKGAYGAAKSIYDKVKENHSEKTTQMFLFQAYSHSESELSADLSRQWQLE